MREIDPGCGRLGKVAEDWKKYAEIDKSMRRLTKVAGD